MFFLPFFPWLGFSKFLHNVFWLYFWFCFHTFEDNNHLRFKLYTYLWKSFSCLSMRRGDRYNRIQRTGESFTFSIHYYLVNYGWSSNRFRLNITLFEYTLAWVSLKNCPNKKACQMFLWNWSFDQLNRNLFSQYFSDL